MIERLQVELVGRQSNSPTHFPPRKPQKGGWWTKHEFSPVEIDIDAGSIVFFGTSLWESLVFFTVRKSENWIESIS